MDDDPYATPVLISAVENRPASGPRPTRLLQACLGFGVIAFSAFVWIAFFYTPTPIPWMMGEVAFERIMTVYAVSMVGSLVVALLALIMGLRWHLKWLMALSIPCFAYLAVVLVRAYSGLPLSLG